MYHEFMAIIPQVWLLGPLELCPFQVCSVMKGEIDIVPTKANWREAGHDQKLEVWNY